MMPATHARRQMSASQAVWDALRDAVEPRLGMNVVDLGLVHDVRVQGRIVRVVLGVLTPDETDDDEMAQRITRAVRARLPYFMRVELVVARDRVWHPGRMSPEARRRLGL